MTLHYLFKRVSNNAGDEYSSAEKYVILIMFWVSPTPIPLEATGKLNTAWEIGDDWIKIILDEI